VRSPPCILLALALALTASTLGAPARADTSAWVFVGGGGLGVRERGSKSFSASGALAFDVGVGTSPDGPVIVGGLFRIEPILGIGTDLALAARVATHGFQAGDFGLALDAGGYARFSDNPSQGFAGGLTVGAPLGLQISLQAMVGTHRALAFGAVAGVDLLRLTVYRQTFLDHWQNPSPAWKRVGRALELAVSRW
jgi:hypothetical protein